MSVESANFIELPVNNLYSTGGLITSFDNDGEEILTREKIDWIPTNEDGYIVVKSTDNMPLIAFKAYKDFTESPEEFWAFIADANDIFNPLDLSDWVGKYLLIPDFFSLKLKIHQ